MSDRIDESVDTPEQALRFLDTVMHSDNEDMRRGAFNLLADYAAQKPKWTAENDGNVYRPDGTWAAQFYQSPPNTRDRDPAAAVEYAAWKNGEL